MKDILSLIPYEVNDYVKSLIEGQDLIIKTVPKRRTKHGDYRKFKNKNIITINLLDNKYRFLLILIHELAHFNVYKKNIRTNPHGSIWKNEFKKLLQPILDKNIFPNVLQILIKAHMKSPKSSFSYDSPLEMELNKYDNDDENYTYLEDIDIGNIFRYNNDKLYKKIEKRRKRYLCIESDSGRKYLFLPHAKVELI
tara:strand:+ start:681 stop:1268 length:588 start_codon:yes stop_codon:yes gene_type:complete